MIGTSRSKRRSSDRFVGHVEHANSAFSPLVRSIANQLPPNERIRHKAQKPRREWTSNIPEDTAFHLLQRIADGETVASVARSASINDATLRNWYEGVNRPDLRRRLDLERGA